MIHWDRQNPRAIELLQRLGPALDDLDLPDDLHLVVGGDGFMLQVIHEIGAAPCFLGVNCGRVGFLLNDVEDVDLFAERLARRAYRLHKVPQLRATAQMQDGRALEVKALNDVYVERKTGQTAHLQIEVDGIEVVRRLACDGVIVATALGSTAYSLAAGGAACQMGIDLVQLTTIAAHSPRLPPIVLPRSARVDIRVLDPGRRSAQLVADGFSHADVLQVRVQDAGQDLRLAFMEGHSPTKAMRKLLEAW